MPISSQPQCAEVRTVSSEQSSLLNTNSGLSFVLNYPVDEKPVDVRSIGESELKFTELSLHAATRAREVWLNLAGDGREAFLRLLERKENGQMILDLRDNNGVSISAHLYALAKSEGSISQLQIHQKEMLNELVLLLDNSSRMSQKNTSNCQVAGAYTLMLDQAPAEFARCARQLVHDGQSILPGGMTIRFHNDALVIARDEVTDPRPMLSRVLQNVARIELARARNLKFDTSTQNTIDPATGESQAAGLDPLQAELFSESLLAKGIRPVFAKAINGNRLVTVPAMLERALDGLQTELSTNGVAQVGICYDVDGQRITHSVLVTKVNNREGYVEFRDPHGATEDPIGIHFKGGKSTLIDPAKGLERVSLKNFKEMLLEVHLTDAAALGIDGADYKVLLKR